MKREIIFFPSWDKRHIEPGKNYGIAGVDFAFYLKGELGTIQFKCTTDWYLPHLRESDTSLMMTHKRPWGTDIGYHSRIPRFEGQSLMTEDCHLLEGGGPCYYDGSSLNAEPIAELLVSEGSDAVWKRLEEEYICRLGELK